MIVKLNEIENAYDESKDQDYIIIRDMITSILNFLLLYISRFEHILNILQSKYAIASRTCSSVNLIYRSYAINYVNYITTKSSARIGVRT